MGAGYRACDKVIKSDVGLKALLNPSNSGTLRMFDSIVPWKISLGGPGLDRDTPRSLQNVQLHKSDDVLTAFDVGRRQQVNEDSAGRGTAVPARC
jgi:hypothetical protein